MVEHLNAILRKGVTPAWCLGWLLAGLPSHAETLVDPTRPPNGFGQAQDGAATAGPVLQSVLISPIRRVAVVSGKTLRVGDKLGDAQLVKISENEVVLRTGKNLQVLKLYPLLRKQASGGHAGGLERSGQ
jgi:MSHA biogenesis protein MshK